MGTYTTNYNLFLPTIGEQGWGDLVNGNFTTIDTTMAELNTRLTAVEDEVNGNLSCTSVTTSGIITSTGKIMANGGIAGGAISGTTGIFTGTVTANRIVETGTITVSCGTPSTTSGFYLTDNVIMMLPDRPNLTYTGSIKFYANSASTGNSKVGYSYNFNNGYTVLSIGKGTTQTLSFSNVPHVYVYVAGTSHGVSVGAITLS